MKPVQKIILVAILSLLNLTLRAQKLGLTYHDCDSIKKFCLDCGDTPAAYKTPDSLSMFFSKSIDREKIRKTQGTFVLQVLVDTSGKACCKSVSIQGNISAKQAEDLHLNQVVNEMPLWTPARTKGKAETSSILLELKIRDGEITADYIRFSFK